MSSDRVNAGTNNSSELLRLAKEKFGNLTKAEERLFIAVAMGMVCDYTDGGKENDDPSKAAEWGELRVLNADRIRWLCTNPKASEIAETRGILVKGAHIKGKIDLLFGKVLFPLYLEKCAVPGGIDLQMAEVKALYLNGTHVGVIEASGLKVDGDVCLDNGFNSQGGVLLVGAKIGGNLKCDKGRFINASGISINADQISVEGGALMGNGFESKGEVRFVNAKIKGVFVCEGGHFTNEGAKALNADSIVVGSNVLMRQGFKAKGEVSLIGAKIGGNLDCYGGEFTNRGAQALCADAVEVRGSVLLRNGFKSEGEVRVVGATIGGDLACNNGHFKNERALALSASGINVQGRIFLREGFKAEGEVRLANGSIGNVLDCGKGQFINKGAVALRADGLRVGHDILINSGFRAEGLVSMKGVIVDGSFEWTGIASPTDLTLDLRSAKIGTLLDGQKSWPKKDALFLDGLVYDRIHENVPRDAKTRLVWLRLQGDKQYRPQPYEQLAEVLKKSGNENDAKEVLIAKNKDRLKWGPKLTFSELWWYRIFGPMIGYGYKPSKALLWVAVFIILGCILFKTGYSKNSLKSVTNDPPKFNSLVYSIDTFVPLVDLYQAKYWLPKSRVLRLYHWVHIAAGWILTTLLVVGLTGLVRT